MCRRLCKRSLGLSLPRLYQHLCHHVPYSHMQRHHRNLGPIAGSSATAARYLSTNAVEFADTAKPIFMEPPPALSAAKAPMLPPQLKASGVQFILVIPQSRVVPSLLVPLIHISPPVPLFPKVPKQPQPQSPMCLPLPVAPMSLPQPMLTQPLPVPPTVVMPSRVPQHMPPAIPGATNGSVTRLKVSNSFA